MAIVVAVYDAFPLICDDGRVYTGQACGRQRPDGRWEGWLEFMPRDGSVVVRSQRETTQRNRADLEYWAGGLTAVYLQGALERILTPPPVAEAEAPDIAPVYDEPAATRPPAPSTMAPAEPVLDPFAVYAQGEEVLAVSLAALSPPELRTIIAAFGLGAIDVDFDAMTTPQLVGWIVGAVCARMAA